MEQRNDKAAQLRNYMRLIEQQTGTIVRPYRADGFVNMLNKYGTQKDASEYYNYEVEPDIPDSQLEAFYEGNGLFSKVIDAPAEEAVKHGFTIKNIGDQEIDDLYQDALDALDWEEAAIDAIKWSRLFGGAIIVMLINDGGALEDPVDWSRVESIDDLVVYDRTAVTPDPTSLYIENYNVLNGGKGKFGMPEFYDVSSTYGNFRVHESRCLVFKNGKLPERATNARYQFWGVPEYIRVHRAIRDAEVAHGSAVKLLDRAVQAVYSMRGLSAEMATVGGEDRVLRRLQTIDMARGMLNTITIDADGEDYSFRQFSFNGVSEVIDTTCNFVSALTNIPQTILFGRSPAGMNATGNGDLENWYNYIERIQKRVLKGNLRYLLNVIFRAAVNIGKIKEMPKVDIEFERLWSLSDAEQAQIDQQNASVEQTRAATAQIYVDMGALDPSEVRKKLAEDDTFDVETMLDDYTEEELEENAPKQQDPMAAMMGALGGGNGAQAGGNPKEEQMVEDEAEANCVGVLVVRDGYVLTGIRADNGTICGPGGHIEEGETPEEAAFRETEEEFGITPKDLIAIGRGRTGENGDTPEIFVCTDYDGEVKCRDGEMDDPRWSSLESLLNKGDALFPPFKNSLSILHHRIYDSIFEGREDEQPVIDSLRELFTLIRDKYIDRG